MLENSIQGYTLNGKTYGATTNISTVILAGEAKEDVVYDSFESFVEKIESQPGGKPVREQVVEKEYVGRIVKELRAVIDPVFL